MQAVAIMKQAHISPQKARLVADQVRGLARAGAVDPPDGPHAPGIGHVELQLWQRRQHRAHRVERIEHQLIGRGLGDLGHGLLKESLRVHAAGLDPEGPSDH